MKLANELLNSLSTAIIIVSDDNTVRYRNAAAQSLMSSASDFSTQIHISQSDVMPSKPVEHYINHVRSSGKDYTYRQAILLGPGAAHRTIDCRISNFEEGGENEVLIEIIPADRITQITRETLLFDQYSAANEIAKGLAHEINNPLSGIRGAAQLLEKTLAKPNQIECTQVIVNEVTRLQGLIKRMLGPNNLPTFSPVNVHDILEHVKFLAESELRTQISINRDYDPSIPLACSDRDQLIQAILNLVRNAIQALGHSGTITLRTRTARNITIGKSVCKLAAKLDVIDDGPGIPHDLQDRIFLPMVKGEHKNQQAEGTGLGLSIAQSLINQNRGYISFESQAGHTVFSVYLPIDTSAQDNT